MLLNDYDTGNVPIPKGDESQWVLTYEDAMLFIRSMPYMPISLLCLRTPSLMVPKMHTFGYSLFAVGRAWVSVSGSIPCQKK